MSQNHLLELAQDIVARAQRAGATDAECTIAEGDEFSANVRMREIENLKEAGSRGAGLRILRGKHTAKFTPFIDTGDHVIVVNAEKIRVTGMKTEEKVYHHYTGYPGGLRSETFRKRFDRKPEAVVEEAIRGMLPKNKLGRAMAGKLKVYRGDKHPHTAQKPEALAADRA